MRESLLIRFGDDPLQPIDWLCWASDSQQVIASGELASCAELNHLSEMAMSRQVIVLLPGTAVSLQQTPLLRVQYRKLQNSLGYLFEEQLAEDPQTLHVCPIEYHDDLLTVAVVHKQSMDCWQQRLTDANIVAEKWLPDYLALPPAQPSQLTLMSYRGGYLLRTAHKFGGWIDANWLAIALEQFDPNGECSLYSDIDASLGGGRAISELNSELPLPVLAPEAITSEVTLLQGEYRQDQPLRRYFKQARYLLISAAVALLLLVANQLAQMWQLQQQAHQGQQQLAQLYQQVFHRAAPQQDYQVQRAFYQLGASQQQGSMLGFLPMLKRLLPTFNQFSDLQFQTLNYDLSRHQLMLRISAPSFASFEQFAKAAKPLQVTNGALIREADRVVGTLTIKEPS
ncbi:type II secretion system protein GspL [Celerinatantimonas yamalensis]|uniref:Type II secretion system protein L n=1 Tax=Celerinatantimonas yamalensis TaxID=559956 RepID=A0ABW9G866_9GAMM